MKLIPGVLNWSYHRQFWNHWDDNLEIYIDKVAALREKYGFEELSFDVGMAAGQDAFKTHDKEYLLQIRKKLEDNHLIPVPIVGAVEVHADPEMVKESIQNMEKIMEEAVILGAKRVQFYQNLHGRLSHEKAVRVLRGALLELSEIAGRLGLTCASEEYCGLSGDELYLAMHDIPNVGLLNDLGNWLILGEDPVAATKKFIGITRHSHLKDYIFEDGIWTSVPFGQGIINLKEALDFLRDYPSQETLYLSFETDIDKGDEDEAMDECFRFYVDWAKGV